MLLKGLKGCDGRELKGLRGRDGTKGVKMHDGTERVKGI